MVRRLVGSGGKVNVSRPDIVFKRHSKCCSPTDFGRERLGLRQHLHVLGDCAFYALASVSVCWARRLSITSGTDHETSTFIDDDCRASRVSVMHRRRCEMRRGNRSTAGCEAGRQLRPELVLFSGPSVVGYEADQAKRGPGVR